MKFSIDDIAVLGRARHLNYGEMAIKISHMNETELSLLYKEAKRLNPSKAKSKSKHCSTGKYFFQT